MIDLDTYITAPIYYRVVRRCRTQWHFVKGETFYNPLNLPKPLLDSLFATFGTSLRSCAAKLISINDGEEGFYLVDIINVIITVENLYKILNRNYLNLALGALTHIYKGAQRIGVVK